MSTTAAVEDPRPSTLPVALCAVSTIVAVGAVAVSLPAAALGLLAVPPTVVGVRRGSRRLHTLGTAALFCAVLVAGFEGAALPLVVVATGAAVLAWDVGENAIGLGQQVGARARTRRVVLLHAAATAAVTAVVGVSAYVVYRSASGGLPTTTLVLLLVAATLAAVLLDS